MRKDVDHLPPLQQGELARVRQILMTEFAKAISLATQPERKRGAILKIILFGSYARSDWVDEPENGYQSDFDLLIVVSNPCLTEIADYWYIAEDKIQHDPFIGRPVNIIVHSLDQVNHSLGRGEYFWVDIARDGIALYELKGHTFSTPMPLTPVDALKMASDYFQQKLGDIDVWIETASSQLLRNDDPERYRRHAAFNFHQAAEAAYICVLLVGTLYFPRSHNIKFLRSLAEDKNHRLIDAWPRTIGLERKRFEMLKRAYVEARYSKSYSIGIEDLTEIATSVRKLRDLVEIVCRDRLDELRLAAVSK